ncbi:hypothetical protein XavaCFBP5823_00370 [Xanthomonas axonopodis pv. vasculorum]|nr:hypothetical protein XavaCFBP5823_00370 [Xanthomonas axonopodis pv. vasculorum]
MPERGQQTAASSGQAGVDRALRVRMYTWYIPIRAPAAPAWRCAVDLRAELDSVCIRLPATPYWEQTGNCTTR